MKKFYNPEASLYISAIANTNSMCQAGTGGSVSLAEVSSPFYLKAVAQAIAFS